MMLQQDEPDDYVIATGETHSVRDLLDVAFRLAGIDDWEPYVKQDPRFDRPSEVDLLIGDATKARDKLGWTPKVDLRGARPDDVRERPQRREREGAPLTPYRRRERPAATPRAGWRRCGRR